MADNRPAAWPRPDRIGKRWRPLPDAAPEPEVLGPARYLGWLVRRQWPRVLYAAVLSSAWMTTLMLPPYIVARGVDDGLRGDDFGAVVRWSAVLLLSGAVSAVLGIARHRTMTFARMYAGFHTVELLTRRTLRLGSAFARQSSTGDLVTVSGSDVQRMGHALTLAGPGVGAVFAYGVVTVLLLHISPSLAALVLLGVPVIALSTGPLLGRLQRAETEYREQQGALTGRAVDLAAGLRVLAGIGGRELFAERYRAASRRLLTEGYRVGAVNSWIAALMIALPSVFLAVVTWFAARKAVAGEISLGELIAVYGYMALLIVPVFFLVEGTDQLVRALVSAGRVVRILRARPPQDEGREAVPPRSLRPELHDPQSGLTVPHGSFVGLVAARPAVGERATERLGRYGETSVTWGGVPLTALPLADVRAQVLVAQNEAQLFAGSLRETVSPGPRFDRRQYGAPDDRAVLAALRAAAADDVVEAMPDGLDSRVEPQGRNLSGGQRQRLRLVRAVLADPEVLLLVEPTSAVDAHTEALVAAGLRTAREGRTTVVVTTSPLLLDRTDLVCLLDEDGRLAATGTHAELLARRADYRGLVLRGTTDEETSGGRAVRAGGETWAGAGHPGEGQLPYGRGQFDAPDPDQEPRPSGGRQLAGERGPFDGRDDNEVEGAGG
ncbi:ABC transporter ATP-binding protein/permease [Streptomyces sp. P38-E01]|uniref:ABC transporter ATP-binding protein/permease n=1 Tax=Streptomyces tardus TaxID=2780544 RepID=A0A949N408_9ACTN|nr:ABC transporter ATP-binding protein [Streptomyces tardus]MBU7597424.1 ABC transporter ATP-binding protein/permease [Streptomyces tardus]